jgi:hypothetical protein
MKPHIHRSNGVWYCCGGWWVGVSLRSASQAYVDWKNLKGHQ